MSNQMEMKRLAEVATPLSIDSAQVAVVGGRIDCPCCGSEGTVELNNDYLNYDRVTQDVQFYEVSAEYVNTKTYYRVSKASTILPLIDAYDALAAQRDEGLAREAECWELLSAYQQRLAEAEKLLRKVDMRPAGNIAEVPIYWWNHRNEFLQSCIASPGCADGEKPATPAINLRRRKVKTEYSTAEEDARADAWNEALDAVEALNK